PGHGGFQQHSDRGLLQRAPVGGAQSEGSGHPGMPHPPAPHPDDLACHGGGPAAHGLQTGNGERGLHSVGPRHHRRFAHLDRAHDLCGPGGLPAHVSPARTLAAGTGIGGTMAVRRVVFLLAAVVMFGTGPGRAQSTNPLPAEVPAPGMGSASRASSLPAPPLSPSVAFLRAGQTPQTPAPATGSPAAAQAGPAPGAQSLSLEDAEKIAVQNHPQIQIAQHRAASAAAQVQEVQSVYFPQATGNLTGVGAETNSRIDSGALNNPIIYDRFASGAYITQFLTDFGRTHELVKSSSLHARAKGEDVETSRADVLLQLHEAYF